MKTLVISVCADPLHEREFVHPVAALCDEAIIVHYKDVDEELLSSVDKIIICGTALEDNEYLDHMKYFEWLRFCDTPLLGICAGMQIIGLIDGAKIGELSEIGMIHVTVKEKNPFSKQDFKAYALHNNDVVNLRKYLHIASSKNCLQIIQHTQKPWFGMMFHPEVRNPEMIRTFLEM